MGLDMYLNKRTYVGADFDFNNVTGSIDIKANGISIPISFNRVSYIIESVGYWRKANAIHSWFVDNVQDGEDDCREYYVSIEQLKELLELCEVVLADNSKAEELLPTQSGFFFGSTEYDEWYFEEIKNTVEMLRKILAEDNNRSALIYQSSW